MRGTVHSNRDRHRHCSLRLPVARRFAALVGFFAVIALAVMLLYRVYVHHTQSEPYDTDEGAVVRLDDSAASPVKIARYFR